MRLKPIFCKSVLGIIICMLCSAVVSKNTFAQTLYLTGQIRSAGESIFIAPSVDSWQIQIKWMKPEGEFVKKGELIILFDTASLESEIEQQESALKKSVEEAKNSRLKLEKKISDASHQLKQATLKFKIARLNAEVPDNFQSQFDNDKFELELIKAATSLHSAENALDAAKQALLADNKKQALEIKRIQLILDKKKNDLTALQIKADRDGIFLHATHQWNGTQINEGTNVQRGMKVGSIPSDSKKKVVAWINQVDRPSVRENMPVALTLDAWPAKTFEGVITRLDRQANKQREWGNSSWYQAEIEAKSWPPYRLVAGMSVRVDLETDSVGQQQPAAQGEQQ